jgi:hypothetical protein
MDIKETSYRTCLTSSEVKRGNRLFAIGCLVLALLITSGALTIQAVRERKQAEKRADNVSRFLAFSQLYGGKHGKACFKCHSYTIAGMGDEGYQP